MPLHAGGDPGRQGWHRHCGAGRGFKQMQFADAVLIGDECDHPAVRRHIERLDIPWKVRRQEPVTPRREIQVGEPLELRTEICRDIQPLAIGAELAVSIGDLFLAIPGRQQRALTRRGVKQPQVSSR